MLHFSDTPLHALLTGGTGFIGQLLVQALLADGHRVSVLSRDPQHAARRLGAEVHCVESLDALSADDPVDLVVNLAGARIVGPRWSEARQAELRRSRVALTCNLVDWIGRAQRKPALLLSGSAIGYYGIQASGDDTELDESAPAQPMFMSDLCREWEQAAGGAAAHGVPVACMRFGLVLGHGGALPMMLLPIRLGLGGRLGSGRQWTSWIHVDDVLRAMAHLWQSNAGAQPKGRGAAAGRPAMRPYNFTAPQAVTQQQFAATAARILHRPALIPTPGWPVRLALGAQADIVLEGQRVVPAALLQIGFRFEYPELAGALEALCAD